MRIVFEGKHTLIYHAVVILATKHIARKYCHPTQISTQPEFRQTQPRCAAVGWIITWQISFVSPIGIQIIVLRCSITSVVYEQAKVDITENLISTQAGTSQIIEADSSAG